MNLGLPEAAVRERVAQALELLAVRHLQDRPTHLLSFGERKRVAIAGAVAMRPAVLALDEPTAGLDPAAVSDTMAALDRLRTTGTSVVLATHDVDLALAWADHVAVVVGGVVRQGDPVGVLADDLLLARARLRRPSVLSVLHRLAGARLVPHDAVARDEAGVRELIDHAPAGALGGSGRAAQPGLQVGAQG